jgi:PhnB protein
MPDQSADRTMAWIEAALADYPTADTEDRLLEQLERRIRMLTMTGIRQGFTTITPYVTVVEIDRLIEFAKQAFGAEEMHRSKSSAGGTHCELRIGDSMVMFGGGGPVGGREKLAVLHLQVPDADAAYRRALEAGAEPVAPPEDKPYGARQGSVKDPLGNRWVIATPYGPVDGPQRTVTLFLVPTANAIGLIDFLKSAFAAEERAKYQSREGKLEYAAVQIGDALVEFGEGPGFPQSAIYMYVPDADEVYQQALKAGARSLYPPADQPYGDRVGGVEDAWGNAWYIASNLSPERKL